jgi:Arc/MetJ family transcription regulator
MEGEMRTNIVIDDILMESAISVSGFKTKKETVEDALKMYIRIKNQKEIIKYKGKIEWEGDLESMRRD